MRFLKLGKGAHDPASGQGCAMEAVSALNGEVWSDAPRCVSKTVSAFVRVFNDFLPDEERPYRITPDMLISLIGTRGDARSELRRARIAVNYGYAVSSIGMLDRNYIEEAAHCVEDAARDINTQEDYGLIVSQCQLAATYSGHTASRAAHFTPHAAKHIYILCVECIEKMVAAGPHAPVTPKHSIEEIAPKVGGFVVK